MIADKMVNLVNNSSVIRAMFEEGRRLAGIYGQIRYMISVWVILMFLHPRKLIRQYMI